MDDFEEEDLEFRVLAYAEVLDAESVSEEERSKIILLYGSTDPEEVLYSDAFPEKTKNNLRRILSKAEKYSSPAHEAGADMDTYFFVITHFSSVEEMGAKFPGEEIPNIGQYSTEKKCEYLLEKYFHEAVEFMKNEINRKQS